MTATTMRHRVGAALGLEPADLASRPTCESAARRAMQTRLDEERSHGMQDYSESSQSSQKFAKVRKVRKVRKSSQKFAKVRKKFAEGSQKYLQSSEENSQKVRSEFARNSRKVRMAT